MFKKTLLFSFLLSLLLTFSGYAKELQLEEGKTYILSFDEEIQNLHTDDKNLNAQILHTIFDDRLQVILSLKGTNDSFLQVKTTNNLFNYEIKNKSVASKELIEIDVPPLENLDVDIYTGD